MSNTPKLISFADLGLSPAIMQAIEDSGYEQPSPIQTASIPAILAGRDVLGQAQTGTGKTAAFALPILSNLKLDCKQVQVLVLTPTRELAIQVAEAFHSYAKHIKGFQVLPIYGGQSFEPQLKQLRRGVHVVVGTPGRVMDHMRRKTLKLDGLTTLVLDEADEMLRMGFIDDVNWILSHTPDDRQIALYSATMPAQVKKVAVTHLNNPLDIKIKNKTATAKNINQRYWMVSGLHKLDALTRLLETETFDGVLIFVRTKVATEELADKLKARGFAAEALNGDLVQKQRERLVNNLKNGNLDILVGTDVVARGLDVERISHVINYHIPYDVESYVHRIGRTGRAGRSGEAILFVARREQRMLRMIEKATKQPIKPMKMPTVADINIQRMQKFKDRISDTIASADLGIYQQLVREFQQETDNDQTQIAAALALLAQGEKGILLKEEKHVYDHDTQGNKRNQKSSRSPRNSKGETQAQTIDIQAQPLNKHPDIEMQRYCLAVGYNNGVKPANIVGMIINEAEIEKDYVGHIEIYDDVCTVDLPADMPKELLQQLGEAFICGHKSKIAAVKEGQKANISPPPARRGGRNDRSRDNNKRRRAKPRSHSSGKRKPAKPRKRSRMNKP
ncbi:DEAD-box ATP-dependent RNA helicase DeaD (= CshA) [hydrothermal vent metagenome]|uniref:RNA helicase n=1 Tax=hydrothermal vent metagenome TaxID=652676 RepID=A0A3B0VHW6_9ZZZZ